MNIQAIKMFPKARDMNPQMKLSFICSLNTRYDPMFHKSVNQVFCLILYYMMKKNQIIKFLKSIRFNFLIPFCNQKRYFTLFKFCRNKMKINQKYQMKPPKIGRLWIEKTNRICLLTSFCNQKLYFTFFNF